MRLAEELEDALGDFRAHFLGLLQFFQAGLRNGIHAAEVPRPRKTAVRSPTKRMPSALSTRGSGFFFEFSMLRMMLPADFLPMRSSVNKLLFGEIVKIGDALHHAAIHQLIHQRIAHAIDIHHAARGEVQNGFLQPRRDNWC